MAFTVSFVVWKFRQLNECLAARLIGLFWLVLTERIWKGCSQLMRRSIVHIWLGTRHAPGRVAAGR